MIQVPFARFWVAGIFALAPIAMQSALLAQETSTATSEEDATPTPAPETNPAVLALLASTPNDSADRLRTIDLLLRMGRADAAENLLDGLVNAQLNRADLADLADQVGPSVLLRLALSEALAPEGRSIAENAADALALRRQNPDFINQQITMLLTGDLPSRRASLGELAKVGEPAAATLVNMLLDDALSADHAAIGSALAALGPIATGPLVAVIDEGNLHQRATAASVLGRAGERRVAYHMLAWAYSSDNQLARTASASVDRLLGRIPSRGEAELLLRKETQSFFRARYREAPSPETAVLWSFDSNQNRIYARPANRHALEAQRIASLSRQLYLLSGLYEDKVSHLAAHLEIAAEEDAKAPSIALHTRNGIEAASGDLVSSALELAMSANLDLAALSATQGLSELDINEAMPAFHRALRYRDPSVRFEALTSIMNQDADVGFSRVTEAIAYFVTAGGESTATFADVPRRLAGDLAAMFRGQGYAVTEASGTVSAIEAAWSNADCELIVLGIQGPNASLEALRTIRRDYRSATTPVVIMVEPGEWSHAERLAEVDDYSFAAIWPADADSLQRTLARIQFLAEHSAGTPPIRLNRAVEAMRIAKSASEDERFLRSLLNFEAQFEDALLTPELARDAAAILAAFGTANSQLTLGRVASNAIFSAEIRDAAEMGLKESIDRHGELTRPEPAITPERNARISRQIGASTAESRFGLLATAD